MARVKRIDVGTLRKPVIREDGTMLVEARLARTGTMIYRNPDGSERREYRPDSEVQASINSFKLRPVTNDHPPDMLTSANAKQYSVGAVGQDVHRDGKWIVGTLAIHDAATIAEMHSGKSQVSCGYDCDLVMESGISPDGERYDCIQTNILGNHLAIVHSARAGADAAVRMDAACSEQVKEDYMDLAQALAELAKTQKELGAVTARADAADKAIEAAKAAVEKVTARLDASEEALKAEKKAHADSVSAAPAKVRARMELEEKAAKLLGKDRFDAKSDDRAIKLAVIKHVANVDCADKSDAYIDARYDAALERETESKEAVVQTHALINKNRADHAGAEGLHLGDVARDEMIKRQHAFKQPGSKV